MPDDTGQGLIGDNYKYDPLYHRMAGFLGVDRYTRENIDLAKKISFIYDWAKLKVGRDDPDSIMQVLHQLQRRLGVNSVGEELLNSLYRSVRLEEPLIPKEQAKPRQAAQETEEEEADDVRPFINKEDLKIKVGEGLRDVQRQVKREVKASITKSISRGIQEALQKASTKTS